MVVTGKEHCHLVQATVSKYEGHGVKGLTSLVWSQTPTEHPTSVVVIILRNRMEHLENTERLCKSSLQCLISTSCISLDRPHNPYMLVLILLKHEG